MEAKPLHELIQSAKESVVRAKTELLTTFAFVPEDKRNGAPSPTARTPVWSARGALWCLEHGFRNHPAW